MAVAGIVVSVLPGHEESVERLLRAHPGIAEVRTTRDPLKPVAVLEVPSRDVEDEMERILSWNGVLTVDIAVISYEDEFAEGKTPECPPRKPCRNREPAVN
jgi:hypothetical protein